MHPGNGECCSPRSNEVVRAACPCCSTAVREEEPAPAEASRLRRLIDRWSVSTGPACLPSFPCVSEPTRLEGNRTGVNAITAPSSTIVFAYWKRVQRAESSSNDGFPWLAQALSRIDAQNTSELEEPGRIE